MPRRQLLQVCSDADIGLSLMPVHSDDLNMVCMTGASNKPFDYLLCGLALVVTDLPGWREVFVEPGYAIACNPLDSASIARALQSLVECPEKRLRMAAAGRERIAREWNYETQFRRVLEQILESEGR